MEVAQRYYEARGYRVTNVSARQSYDLRCAHRERVLHVEVKGTTGAPASVLVTPAEVEHARAHPSQAVLFVVHGIAVRGRHSANPSADGGEVLVLQPWEIDDCRIEVESVTLRCHLPQNTEPVTPKAKPGHPGTKPGGQLRLGL